MKIFLPFKIKGVGGTATFAKKFKKGMEREGHEVFFEYQPDYDVLFMIVQAPFKYLLKAKLKNKKIVQRLDGNYYWSTVGAKFILYNLKALIIRHFFADFTIYQSKYCKKSANIFLGKKLGDIRHSKIIYNGVDLDIFSPDGEKNKLRDNNDQKIFFTVTAFRREEQVVPLLEALKIYQKKYSDNFKFIIAGDFTQNIKYIPNKYKNFKNAIFLGKIENEAVPNFERNADAFLFSQLNPPCPNVVVEALACGLPVCGMADGSMPELVSENKNGLLAPTCGNAFWKMRKYDLEKFADNLNYIMKNRQGFSNSARQSALERFSLDKMIEEYINVLENIK